MLLDEQSEDQQSLEGLSSGEREYLHQFQSSRPTDRLTYISIRPAELE